MQIITHRKHAVNITQAERIASAVGGGILAAAGLHKRSATGLALAMIGGDLLRRGITGHSFAYEMIGIRTAPLGQGAETTSVPYELGIRVDRSITIARPRAEIYRFWRNLSNLPRFMKNVRSVTEECGTRSHWVVEAPGGRTVEWDAVIHNELENELIAWRSLAGAQVANAGSVWFQDAPGGRGTEVKVELQYNPPAGALGAIVASLFGKEPGQQIREDLYRLKALMETGEVVTVDGQTSGARRPHERQVEDREVQMASEGSFPASDAPAWNH
ncbi:MAG: cyclase [Proteobacteria bacterium]|nr:MAG: cyclase [Pseudomonadota bacterium]